MTFRDKVIKVLRKRVKPLKGTEDGDRINRTLLDLLALQPNAPRTFVLERLESMSTLQFIGDPNEL